MTKLRYSFVTIRRVPRFRLTAVLSFLVISYVLITCINLVQVWSDPFDDFLIYPRPPLQCNLSTKQTTTSSITREISYNKGTNFSSDPNKSKSKMKTILYWNAWSSTMGNQPLVKAGCSVTACLFTSDLTMFNQSDVVLFSIETLPDFVVDRMPHQRFVFYILESPTHTLQLPTLMENRTRYNYFNWTMTYRRDSDIVLRDFMGSIVPKPAILNHQKDANYLAKQYPPSFHPDDPASPAHHPNYRPISKISSVDSMKNHRPINKTYHLETFDDKSSSYWFKTKNKMIAWFVSHCQTPIEREEYARLLGQYVAIDYFGGCTKHHRVECREDEGCKDEDLLRKDYKFYLAFENSFCPDYVTEKFYRTLKLDVVPIVLGGAEYERFAPPHSYINALDFETPKHLADYLLLLNSSDSLYSKYFDWKEQYQVEMPSMDGWCDLCRMAHDDSLPTKVYSDIKKWWVEGGECENDRSKYF